MPLDDLLVYHMAEDHYLVVVNAANNDKDWAWVNGVLSGAVQIDPNDPGCAGPVRPQRDPARLARSIIGADMRAELALQGPKARDILLAWAASRATWRPSRGSMGGIARVTSAAST
jgi:glycine hydroxymethyltransferase